jgi:2-oxoglutarate dehydrogenase complex dehydrogenase (E1) component-like enzyme
MIDDMKNRFRYIGRRASAATATGSHKKHILEQEKIIEEAMKFEK